MDEREEGEIFQSIRIHNRKKSLVRQATYTMYRCMLHMCVTDFTSKRMMNLNYTRGSLVPNVPVAVFSICTGILFTSEPIDSDTSISLTRLISVSQLPIR